MKIQARVEILERISTNGNSLCLVVEADGKTQPYLEIPDTFSDEALEEMIKRLEGE